MISSIDTATMLPRTIEAADLQGRENQLINHAAQQNGEQFQQRVNQNQHQTVETQKTETDSESQGSGRGDEHHARKKKKKEEGEAPMAPRSNSSFDIMI